MRHFTDALFEGIEEVNEALHSKKEINDFFKICDELGLRNLGDLQRFADENKNRIAVNNLLAKHGLTLTTDAFFETLKDYKREEFGDHFQAIPDDQNPEFNYDGPTWSS